MFAQRVLLTGGAGFIGSHVAESLLNKGATLTIVDNLDDFYSRAQKERNLSEIRRNGRFDFYNLNISDFGELKRVAVSVQPEIVVHLAARAGVRPSIEKPHDYEQVNVSGTINLLEVSRSTGIRKFIFGSSSSVYGDQTRIPFSESQVDCRPISPYAATKLAGELFCYTYARLYSIPTVCLRFFTVYGPRQRPDLAIYKFTECIENGWPISVFGDGLSARDYTYVSDIVTGIIAAAQFEPEERDSARFEVFNLGNSRPIELSRLLDCLERATGRRAIRRQAPPQPGDVHVTCADISKARRLLGYQPRVNVDEGLKAFVEWFRKTVLAGEAVKATSVSASKV